MGSKRWWLTRKKCYDRATKGNVTEPNRVINRNIVEFLVVVRCCKREGRVGFSEVVDVEDWRRGSSFAAGHPTSFLASGDAVIVGASVGVLHVIQICSLLAFVGEQVQSIYRLSREGRKTVFKDHIDMF